MCPIHNLPWFGSTLLALLHAPLAVAIGLVVATGLVELLSGHVLYQKRSLVKRAAAVLAGGGRVARLVVPEEELGGDGSEGSGGPEFIEQPGFATNRGFSAEITAAPSPCLNSEDMSLLRMMSASRMASIRLPPDPVDTYLPEPDTTLEIVEEEIVELATSPDHVGLTSCSSLSSSSDGQLGISVESSSDKVKRELLAKLVRGGYRMERMWEASRDSMEQFDKKGVMALGYSRVSFSSLNIEPRTDSMRYCVFERVWDDICAPRVVIACRGTAGLGDLLPDVRFIFQLLHSDGRIKELAGIVAAVLNKYEVTDVCIAGHSIGAAAALVVGTKYAAQGVFLDTHLFNPPFCAFSGSSFKPVRKLTKVFKGCTRVGQKCVVRTVGMLSSNVGNFLNKVLDGPHHRFWGLDGWKPVFYLHEDDVLCNGYIHDFRSMRKLDSMDPASFKAMLGRYVAPESVLGLTRLGPRSTHMVPSAELRIISSGRGRASTSSSSAFSLHAHRLDRWIERDIVVSKEVVKVSGAAVPTQELLQAGFSELCRSFGTVRKLEEQKSEVATLVLRTSQIVTANN